MIYGLKQIAQDGLGLLPAVSILAGLALGVAFVRRQRALADPLIDLRLFRLPAFSGSLATFTLAIFAMFGTFLFIAQYLQLVLGLSPLEAGLWTLPQSGGFIVGSMLAPLIVRRIRPAFVMGAGLGLGAVGLALLTQIDAADGLAVLVTSSVVMSLGLGPVFHLGYGPDHRDRATRASRSGVGDLRNQRRIRWGSGHRGPRQHRHRRVPQRCLDAVPDGSPRRRRGPRTTPSAAPWPWLSSCPTGSAPRWSRQPRPRSQTDCR